MSFDPIVEALQQYSTCDVADAMQKLGYVGGGFLEGITLQSPPHPSPSPITTAELPKIIGPAHTVRYYYKDPACTKKPTTHYIDTLPPSSILLISAPRSPETRNALFGGLMAARAKTAGAEGIVVDGRIRDLEEHWELGAKVWARGTGITGAGAGSGMEVREAGGSVTVGGVVVEEGDYLIGDVNGVACVPRDVAEKVVKLIPSQVEADERIRRGILEEGRGFEEASKEFRREVLKAEDV